MLQMLITCAYLGCKENRTHWSRLADEGNTAQQEEEKEAKEDVTTESKKESKLDQT